MADSSWKCYYMLGTIANAVLSFERKLGLGITVTEINIKKVQKQDLENIRNVKGCRDGTPKSMQTRWGWYNSEGKFTKPCPYMFLHYSCKLV